MAKLNYLPGRLGFHFNNNFTDHVGPATTYGLRGGMSLRSGGR